MGTVSNATHREPWNKGKIVGQKAPFKLKDTWALRVRFQMEDRVRERALFNLGIDSKLRGCDLIALKVQPTFRNNWRLYISAGANTPQWQVPGDACDFVERPPGQKHP